MHKPILLFIINVDTFFISLDGIMASVSTLILSSGMARDFILFKPFNDQSSNSDAEQIRPKIAEAATVSGLAI